MHIARGYARIGGHVTKDKAQEKAPEITLADIAGMVKTSQDETKQHLGALGDRLTKLESAPAKPGKATAKAKDTVEIPHTAELGALKGACSPGAQGIQEGYYRKGKAAMTAQVKKLLGYQNDPTNKPSNRYAYAKALLAAMPASGPKVIKAAE